MNWEVFLPERYKVKDFGGDVIASNLVPAALRDEEASRGQLPVQPEYMDHAVFRSESPAGQMGGYVTDQTGAMIANAQITVTSTDNGSSRSTVTDSSGHWVVIGMPSGNYKIKADSSGFKPSSSNANYNANEPSMYASTLTVGNTSETIEVQAQVQQQIQTLPSSDVGFNGRNFNKAVQLAPGAVGQNASANVVNLQKRVAGVLPVVIDVPRTGTMFSFVRPLVLDEETKVTFSYKSR